MMKSQEWKTRIDKIIPYGSSTCSKSAIYPPEEPGIIVKGKGCRVWDADDREFIDFRNSLGPITLGYGFDEVDNAIRTQLEKGIIFGHPHTVECETAELFCELIDSAEQARFMKTGGEAISACIRIARAYTGKKHIIQIGYNGWLNSLSGRGQVLPGKITRGAPPGVPQCLSDLHHSGKWNDIAGIENLFDEYKDDIAAVVVASDYKDMAAGKNFYPALRKITKDNNALLVLDEIVTGFRIAVGGVQEYVGVDPDLMVFAKGIANGMPVSIYAGKKDIMALCDKDGSVSISITHGGETLSLAAAKATMTFYKDNNVVEHLWSMGTKLMTGLNGLFQDNGLAVRMSGLPPCQILVFDEEKDGLRESLFRAAYRNGVSLYNVCYVNFSHKASDIDETLDRMKKAIDSL